MLIMASLHHFKMSPILSELLWVECNNLLVLNGTNASSSWRYFLGNVCSSIGREIHFFPSLIPPFCSSALELIPQLSFCFLILWNCVVKLCYANFLLDSNTESKTKSFAKELTYSVSAGYFCRLKKKKFEQTIFLYCKVFCVWYFCSFLKRSLVTAMSFLVLWFRSHCCPWIFNQFTISRIFLQ